MIRAAVIGIGNMGKKYALLLHNQNITGMELAAVCARSEESFSWAKENLDGVAFYHSTAELFEHSDEFDAVIIATPHKEHLNIALEAFQHNKHVFCDKPAGISVGDAKIMTAAANNAGLTYAMMFQNRTYPIYRKIKEMLDGNQIGDILRIHLVCSRYYRTAHYHNSAPWRSSFTHEGGGALINQGQHILDLGQWLFGMPESVYASIPFGKYNDFIVDDEVTMLMNYENRKCATFILTTGEAFGEERLEIVGSKGKILVENHVLTWYHSDIDSRIYGQRAVTNSLENYPFTYEKFEFTQPANPYITMLENFVGALEGREALIVEGSEGEKALMLANAAYLSAWKQTAVTLPFDINEYEHFLEIQKEKEAKKIMGE